MAVRKHEDPDAVAFIRRGLHQDGPDRVDETLALAGEILLVTGWKLDHGKRIVLRGRLGECLRAPMRRTTQTAPGGIGVKNILPGDEMCRKSAS